MSIETPDDLERLKAAGRIVAQAIQAMRASALPGVTTGELDRIGGLVFARAGARSGPQLDYGFPGVNCISVNDEAVHGIPGKRRLRPGDLVKLDVTAEHGFGLSTVDGGRLDFPLAMVLEVRDGLVVRFAEYFDTAPLR